MGKEANTKKTKEQKKLDRQNRKIANRKEIREHKGLFSLYIVLRVIVVAVLIRQIFIGNYNNVFLCGLTLVLFLIPSFVEKRLHIDVPNTLEVIILLFIFSAEILGEIQEYYLIFPFWDTMLHTLNGFFMAAIGFSMVDILNRSSRFKVTLSPVFVAVVSFCFSMTIGVLWEFFEYGMDVFFLKDMQKDTWLQTISSVALNPDGKNIPKIVPIESMTINGQSYSAYLDIGLHDTMKDLLVNFVGAVVFSIIGLLYIVGRGKGTFARRFILRFRKSHRGNEEKASPLLEAIPLNEDGVEEHTPVKTNATQQTRKVKK